MLCEMESRRKWLQPVKMPLQHTDEGTAKQQPKVNPDLQSGHSEMQQA